MRTHDTSVLPARAEVLTLFACLSAVLGDWPMRLVRHARDRLTGDRS